MGTSGNSGAPRVPGTEDNPNGIATSTSSTQSATALIAATTQGISSTNVPQESANGSGGAASNPAQLDQTNPTSKGLSPGPVAGIAVGCFIAGLVIAGAVLFLLFLRYKKQQRPKQIDGFADHLGVANGGYIGQEKAVVPNHKGAAAVSVVETYLPQPVEDDAITGAMSKLRTRIKDYAKSYFHNAPIDQSAVHESQLQDLSIATEVPTATLKDWLLNPLTRNSAIRLYLSWVIFSRCSGGQTYPGASFLPPEVSGFADVVATSTSTDAGQVALMSKWKAISGAILKPRYSQLQGDADPRNEFVGSSIGEVDSVLRPFIGQVDEGQRKKNLESLMRAAAHFAFLLFSQPSSWQFDFAGHGGIVVCPALLQTVNDEAQVLNPPRVFEHVEIIPDN